MGSKQVHSCPTCGRNQGLGLWDNVAYCAVCLRESHLDFYEARRTCVGIGLIILCENYTFPGVPEIQLQNLPAEQEVVVVQLPRDHVKATFWFLNSPLT